MEEPAHGLEIKELFRSQVSEKTKGLEGTGVGGSRTRSCQRRFPRAVRTDALYEKVRANGRSSIRRYQWYPAVPMAEAFREFHGHLFQPLYEQGLRTPKLVVFDAHPGF